MNLLNMDYGLEQIFPQKQSTNFDPIHEMNTAYTQSMIWRIFISTLKMTKHTVWSESLIFNAQQ